MGQNIKNIRKVTMADSPIIKKLREVTIAASPVSDKLTVGKMDLNETEIHTMRTAFETWRFYLESI